MRDRWIVGEEGIAHYGKLNEKECKELHAELDTHLCHDPSLSDFANLSPDAIRRLRDALEKSVCEDSLYEFLKMAWPAFDPAPFVDGWHLAALAEHLEAVFSLWTY